MPCSRPVSSRSGRQYRAGEVIANKYKLERTVGEGGMGAVWLARNQDLDVEVAIKLIRADIENSGAADRLLTEARAAARLKHPSIVRIFDFGRTELGDPFIVMELLAGETLGDILDRDKTIEPVLAIRMLLPIADGLAVAHASGVVHRDVKPENFVMADVDGRLQPKVLDFGIAKVSQQSVQGRITQAGAVLGSPDYMSPEQAAGMDDIDARSDVWSFCVVLYECLTGRLPFEDNNYNALLRKIIEESFPPLAEFGVGDARLWEIIESGLNKDREQRWQDMRQLGAALAHWLMAREIYEDACGQSLHRAWLEPRTSLYDISSSAPPRSRPFPTATSAVRAKPQRITQPEMESARPLKRWLSIAGVAALAAALAWAGFMALSPDRTSQKDPDTVTQGEPTPKKPHAESQTGTPQEKRESQESESTSAVISLDTPPAKPEPGPTVSPVDNTLPTPQKAAKPPAKQAKPSAPQPPTAEPPKPTSNPERPRSETYDDFGF